ncbi:hypothetical protein L1987_61669 [Smallanthus sonchifolius]|uniref:Uncharacterized protein n=1 Tax=Smallanthus sonchifolius TaxID=185202 RepID=A0ACB9C899_9ASTR|nr:hypothetical protein L1987_61669 [Smallanthus sonchifolius]
MGKRARAYARVQFTTRNRVEYILKLANSRKLWYDTSYLKAWERDIDLVQKPRQFAFEMEGATLHFGCQVPKECLSLLCKLENASVKFGFGLRKLYFGVPWFITSYKLQLSYENIWQVQLHCPHGVASRFLVIQICALVQHGCIPGPVLDANFFALLDPQRCGIESIEYVMEKLYFSKHCCYDPVRLITEEYRKNKRLRSPAISLDSGLVYVRRVQITPSKVYFCGPEVNVSNRVLRHYSDCIDNFLRVSFLDEELEKLYSTDLSPKLQDNSAWMFASTERLNAAEIRNWMGDFSSIKNVAKYAARFGQSFGSSKESLSVPRYEVEQIPDIEIVRSGTKYVFSDGIGKISAEFARKLITLLSTLGVKDHIFEKKQKEAVCLLDAVLVEPTKAEEALELMSPGENTNVMKGMLSCGYKPNAEPFLSMMLQVFRATKLLELRTKMRIFVPKGRSMMGCLDETRTLEYGQVFVQFSSAGRKPLGDDYSGIGSYKSLIVRGNVVVAKNPCLHPGDVRILKAVNVPALHHIVDFVVFPQKGNRPHPNECSGSDLDGDIYFVCWDPDLIPPQQFEPMDYTPAPIMQLDHDVTIEDVEYFANYIVNDSLGIIANAHTIFAVREPAKAMARPCVELAKLFSIAVDFPKTAELLTGSIMKMSRSFDRRNDAKAVGLAVKSLRKEMRNWFKNGGDRDTEDDNVYAKASAWYHATYHPDYWGRYDTTRDHFLSFPWCVHDKLIEIKKRKASIRRHVEYDSITH